MARELNQPTEAFDLLADKVMGPFSMELTHMLQPHLPEGIERERLTLNLLSVFALVIYFNFARVPVSRMTGRKYDRGFKAQLVEHIMEFSLKGLGLRDKEEDK